MRHHHHQHHDEHHQHHHHPHAHPLPRLISVFSEALSEHHFESIETLSNLIHKRQPRLMPMLDNILNEGINDPDLVVELLQIEEAVGTLRSLRELILLSGSRKAAAILPLPPDIWHRLVRALHSDLVFSSEDHLPPHLAFEDYQQLESLMPRDLHERVNQLEAVVLEGCFEKESLLFRRNTARFLQMITSTNRKPRLYVRVIPHRPHHADFCALDLDIESVLI